MTGQQVATNRPTLFASLEAMKPQIAAALPAHLDMTRFARIVTTQLKANPKLAHSTPESFFGAVLTASALGLEPGVLGQCYLVPYKDKDASSKASLKAGHNVDVYECQLIVGYQGLATLFWQHPLAAGLRTEFVCQNDDFSYTKGLNATLHHVPAPKDRGPVTHYYAVVELTTGARAWDVLTAAEVQVLRGKPGGKGDIADPQHWMERKTVLKQVMKLMPRSTTFAAAAQADEQVGSLKVAKQLVDAVDIPAEVPPDEDAAGELEGVVLPPEPTDADPGADEVMFPDYQQEKKP